MSQVFPAVRILVADDSAEFLAGVCDWVAAQPGLLVVGVARSGREAITTVARLQPDLVLMDDTMADLDGFAATRILKLRNAAPWVVILGFYDDLVSREAAWMAGADGFVPKAEIGSQLRPLIHALAGSGGRDDAAMGSHVPDRPGPTNPGAGTRGGAPLARIAVTLMGQVSRVLQAFQSPGQSRSGSTIFGNSSDLSYEEGRTMSKRVWSLVTVMSLVAAFATSATQAQVFTPMGLDWAGASDMSNDGSVVVGTTVFGFGPNYRWTRDGGVEVIGGGCTSGQPTVSGDGQVVAGCALDENGLWNAAKWLGGTDWRALGSVPGAVSCDQFLSGMWDLTDDGSKGVGLAYLPQICRAHAGQWDMITGAASDLGSSVPNRASRANGISGNGRVIIGWQDAVEGYRQGAKWVDGVEQLILSAQGSPVGEALGTNSDGSVIVGEGAGPSGVFAWRWKQGQFTTFGTAAVGVGGGPGIKSLALDTNEDGSVVVGFQRNQFNGASDGFIWQNGVYSRMDQYLKKLGVTAAAGWHISGVSAVSANGRVLAGWGENPDGVQDGWVLEF